MRETDNDIIEQNFFNDDSERDIELETSTKRRMSARPSSEEKEGTQTLGAVEESGNELDRKQSSDLVWRVARSRKWRTIND